VWYYRDMIAGEVVRFPLQSRVVPMYKNSNIRGEIM